jgi:hypothetical protein
LIRDLLKTSETVALAGFRCRDLFRGHRTTTIEHPYRYYSDVSTTVGSLGPLVLMTVRYYAVPGSSDVAVTCHMSKKRVEETFSDFS